MTDGRMDRWTDRRTHGPTKRVVESRNTRLTMGIWECAPNPAITKLKARNKRSRQFGEKASNGQERRKTKDMQKKTNTIIRKKHTLHTLALASFTISP